MSHALPGRIVASRSLGLWRQGRWSSTLAAKKVVSKPDSAPSVPAARPLAGLPAGMLLRSLLVAGVSSHGLLLRPALAVLSFLTRPKLPWLLSVDRNPLLHGLLRRTFYDQFCAGEGAADTRACVQRLKDLGFRGVILTYARETVFDHKTQTVALSTGETAAAEKTAHCPHIESWRVGTLETLDLITEGDILAVKLTGAGPVANAALHQGQAAPPQLMAALEEICERCRERGCTIIVDAESQHFQAGITATALALMRQFNRDGGFVVWNTYQAYLKATPDLLAAHLAAAARDGFILGLKLVRGAYLQSDERARIHDSKTDTDAAYDRIAQGALRREMGTFGGTAFPSVRLFLASHNRASVVAARRLHQQRTAAGLPTVPVGFGQLHGMADAVSFTLVQDTTGADGAAQPPPDVYKCTTWGSLGECLGYLVRRAAENRDAVLRTADEYAALKAELWRRLRWAS